MMYLPLPLKHELQTLLFHEVLYGHHALVKMLRMDNVLLMKQLDCCKKMLPIWWQLQQSPAMFVQLLLSETMRCGHVKDALDTIYVGSAIAPEKQNSIQISIWNKLVLEQIMFLCWKLEARSWKLESTTCKSTHVVNWLI